MAFVAFLMLCTGFSFSIIVFTDVTYMDLPKMGELVLFSFINFFIFFWLGVYKDEKKL